MKWLFFYMAMDAEQNFKQQKYVLSKIRTTRKL